ncbi:MAG TPA: hypothetical protein VN457_07165, partial [Chlamydiales bacterium]|nr:hypothetical protein [Chlamydiales bacterium]
LSFMDFVQQEIDLQRAFLEKAHHEAHQAAAEDGSLLTDGLVNLPVADDEAMEIAALMNLPTAQDEAEDEAMKHLVDMFNNLSTNG